MNEAFEPCLCRPEIEPDGCHAHGSWPGLPDDPGHLFVCKAEGIDGVVCGFRATENSDVRDVRVVDEGGRGFGEVAECDDGVGEAGLEGWV